MRIFGISPFQINKNTQTRENPSVQVISRGGAFTLTRDTVSFGGEREKVDGYHYIYVPQCKRQRLRELQGVPCIYCGETMLNDSDVKSLGRKMSELHGQKLIDYIEEKDNFFRGNRREVVKRVIAYVENHPEANLKMAIDRLAIAAIGRLEAKQLAILRQIYRENIGKFKKSNKHDAWLFKNIIKEGCNWIESENNDDSFKRKDFIECCKKRLESIHNKKLARRIAGELEQLPTSLNDDNAYIVKYSRRSAEEIAETLFSEATSSIEHIRPQSEYDTQEGKWRNGINSWHNGDKDDIANFVLACRGCNSHRKSIPLDEYYAQRPEIQLYAEDQLRYIAKNTPYGDYVAKAAKTLEEESLQSLNLKEFYV